MMKIAMISLMVLGTGGVGLAAYAKGERVVAPGARGQQQAPESAEADVLYDLVKQARAELREMRVVLGLDAYAAAPPPAPGERREGGEGGAYGGAEHDGNREAGEGEGTYLPKMTKQNKLFANGARLALRFDPMTQVFAGSVTNTTARTLPQVRVEVHLDNGTELGPTKRADVGPGQTVIVELGAYGNAFGSWVSHPEAGVERGHGAGGDEGTGEHGGGEGRGEDRGEHGGGEDARPRGAAYRPVYNQLQILRGEIHALEAELGARSRREGTPD